MADNANQSGSTLAALKARLGLARFGVTERKTVTFGDGSAVVGSPFWSITAVVALGLLWVASSYYEWTDPTFLPGPGAVWTKFVDVYAEGYRRVTLQEHVFASLSRILYGFSYGCLIGIPLGLAMGLSNILRGIFDPIVEFFRPIPPLAFIPLVIIWFGIGEESKRLLLFLAALWIMVIAARSGVLSVKLSKVHAAYSLGASKWQVLRYVILPNALPEIFIGMRVALGVCWGTLVAAELLGAQEGIGQMIWVAQKFFLTEIVIIGIVLIGIIGVAMDLLMRLIESWLIPWRGKG
ncbi:MAG: taurine transport system permease protein [Cellvibrionaceae bacterium]|jgi:taurine transport system permease protein